MRLAAVVVLGLGGLLAAPGPDSRPASLGAAAQAAHAPSAAANRPPRFPKTFKWKTDTSFSYDDAGDLDRAVTKITVVTRAVDPDGDRLTYRWKASNGTIRGKGPTGTWTRVLRYGEPKPGKVTVTARDGHGGSASFTFDFP